MHSLKRLFCSSRPIPRRHVSTRRPPPSTGLEEWNDAWETAWLPNDGDPVSVSPPDRAPWEDSSDKSVNGESLTVSPDLEGDLDGETKAFVAEMDDRWSERKAAQTAQTKSIERMKEETERGKRKGEEYRVKKQRIHAGLWAKEIERLEESSLGGNGGDEIDRMLDSCAEIFESGNNELCDPKIPSSTELKTKPDGWENTSKNPDGNENIWDISQREEDILLQEFERRIAFTKHQIGSFLKTHIFSRRRPIDGWKYMIEEIGPNARKGKGSVQRLPSIADSALQPFKEEKEQGFRPNPSSRRR